MQKIKKVTIGKPENYPVERVAHYWCYEMCEWEPSACQDRCGESNHQSHFDQMTYNGWFAQMQ